MKDNISQFQFEIIRDLITHIACIRFHLNKINIENPSDVYFVENEESINDCDFYYF